MCDSEDEVCFTIRTSENKKRTENLKRRKEKEEDSEEEDHFVWDIEDEEEDENALNIDSDSEIVDLYDLQETKKPVCSAIKKKKPEIKGWIKGIDVKSSVSHSSSLQHGNEKKIKKTKSQGKEMYKVPISTEDTMLKEHQKVGYRWMMKRESWPYKGVRGGILADEAGLGKTLQMLELIDSNCVINDSKEKVNHNVTLVCVSSILVKNWVLEISTHKPCLRYTIIDNHTTPLDSTEEFEAMLKDVDIILVTHDQLALGWMEIRKSILEKCEKEAKEKYPPNQCQQDLYFMAKKKIILNSVGGEVGFTDHNRVKCSKAREALFTLGRFLRIVVDEAHVMRNSNTGLFEALFRFPASRRWYVSATPINNSKQDLFAAFKFLRADQANDKKIWFKTTDDEIDNLLGQVMLRREKKTIGHQDDTVRLPEIIFQNIEAEFVNPYEKKLHDKLYEVCRLRKVEEEEEKATKMENNKRPTKKRKKKKSSRKRRKGKKDDEDDEEEQEEENTKVSGKKKSILGFLIRARQTCYLPFFKESTSQGFPKVEYKAVQKIALKDVTKMRMLKECIKQIPQEDSAVIFTQWVYKMNEVAQVIEDGCPYGKKCFVLNGSMTDDERWNVLEEFKNTPGSYLLTSLMLACFGLTLVSANWVLFLDQWWNPKIIDQAKDRVYRMGQKKVVNVLNLIILDSIEAKILKLHEMKNELSDKFILSDSLDNVEAKIENITPSDLRFMNMLLNID